MRTIYLEEYTNFRWYIGKEDSSKHAQDIGSGYKILIPDSKYKAESTSIINRAHHRG